MLPLVWGATRDEHRRAYPADDLVDGPVAWSWSRLLAWGDTVMMRRQLLNLKELAEGA